MSRTHRAAEPGAHLAAQRSPVGSQTEGMEAIRAVWERAADTERRRARPGPVRRREPKRLAPALTGTLVCACLLMFFAWVGAPALWMTMGHSQSGTVTVTSCAGGFAPGCTGLFETGSWSKELRLTGAVTEADVGAELAARATGPDTSSAYVGGGAGLVLRWAPAAVLYMCSGFALVAASGAARLYEGRGAAIGLCWAATGGVWAAAMAFAW
ncbi:hypothetical protein L0U85_07460 [Glycomyces sp. L485]|uniref:hypothetical protein n=1 Tax=Glycomyces sp. L485 TaxID=2909235 RepID=UPI001F4AEF79|nr:hypothetical protein [Glycomyces sp. L485]MCH7230687.1 hypothetical protein [Glycomyces sp. L485]